MQTTVLDALVLKSSSCHIVTFCASEVITSQHILKRKGSHKPRDTYRRGVLVTNLHYTYQPLSPIVPWLGKILKEIISRGLER